MQKKVGRQNDLIQLYFLKNKHVQKNGLNRDGNPKLSNLKSWVYIYHDTINNRQKLLDAQGGLEAICQAEANEMYVNFKTTITTAIKSHENWTVTKP